MSTEHEICVGYDGSPSAEAALRWATTEAERRGARVSVVVAVRPGPIAPWALPADHEWRAFEWDRAEVTAREASALVGDHAAVRTTVQEGLPGRVLAECSAASDLLVVGSAGAVGLAGWIRGSVSRYLLHHARCPLVVVGPHSDCGDVRAIVLSATLDPDGVAFPATADWVRRHRLPVRVIGSYAAPTLLPDLAIGGPTALEIDVEEMREHLDHQMADYVTRLQAVLPGDASVTTELNYGLPNEVLDRHTGPGDLLIVPRGNEHDVPFAHGCCPVCVV